MRGSERTAMVVVRKATCKAGTGRRVCEGSLEYT